MLLLRLLCLLSFIFSFFLLCNYCLLLLCFLFSFFSSFLLLFFFITWWVIDLERIFDCIQSKLLLLKFLSFESTFHCFYIGEFSSKLFLWVKWYNVRLLLLSFFLSSLWYNSFCYLFFGFGNYLLLFFWMFRLWLILVARDVGPSVVVFVNLKVLAGPFLRSWGWVCSCSDMCKIK